MIMISRRAVRATVVDGEVRESKPFFFGDDFHEILLDFDWTSFVREIVSMCESFNVRVDSDPFDNTKRIS